MQQHPTFGERLHHWGAKLRGDPVVRDLRKLRAAAERVEERASGLRALSDTGLKQRARVLRQTPDPSQAEGHLIAVFALVREVAHRSLGLWAFEAQLMAAWVLSRGGIAQMHTGEGVVYEREAHESFRSFQNDWQTRVVELFEGALITRAGIDLAREGLRDPGSTWTYLLTDRPDEPRTPRRVLRSRWVEWRE